MPLKMRLIRIWYKQVLSTLEVIRKFMALLKEWGFSDTLAPRRRRLLELLEGLTDEEVEQLVDIIENQLKSK